MICVIYICILLKSIRIMEFDDVVDDFETTTFIWLLELRYDSGSYYFSNLPNRQMQDIKNGMVDRAADGLSIEVWYKNQWGERFAGRNIDEDIVDRICSYIIRWSIEGSPTSKEGYWVSNSRRERYLDSLPLYIDKPFHPHPDINSNWTFSLIGLNTSMNINLTYFRLIHILNNIIKPNLEAYCRMSLLQIKQNDYLSKDRRRSIQVSYKDVYHTEYKYPNITREIYDQCIAFLSS